jgi:hypothetical protein
MSEIYTALSAVMKRIHAVPKDAVNKEQRWAYRSAEALYNHVHALLKEQGIFITTTVKDSQRLGIETKYRTMPLAVITYKICFHAPDGSSVTTEAVGEAADAGDKASGKALTYAIKSAIQGMFLVPTADMQDPDQNSHKGDQKDAGNIPALISEKQVKYLYTVATNLKIDDKRVKKLLGVDSVANVVADQYDNALESLKQYASDRLIRACAKAESLDTLKGFATKEMLAYFHEGTEARNAYAAKIKELIAVKKTDVPDKLVDWLNDLKDVVKEHGKDAALKTLSESDLSADDKTILEQNL